MFVAPVFDKSYGNYINLTSLIMMGSEGECIIEKGVERARLRVRNQPPKHIENMTWDDPNKPPIFCQLDAHRKLGQTGLFTLAKPGNAGMKDGKFLFRVYRIVGRIYGFRTTPIDRYIGGADHLGQKLETGSTIQPRYMASAFKKETSMDGNGDMFDVAEEVYVNLIHDRKMEFIGCHAYPDFTTEQLAVLEKRKSIYEKLLLPDDGLKISESSPFWAQNVRLPDSSGAGDVSRYSLFLGQDLSGQDVENYTAAKTKVDDAVAALKTVMEAKAEDAQIKLAEYNLLKEKILFSLWPLKKSYTDLFQYVRHLEDQFTTTVPAIYEATGELSNLPPFSETSNPEEEKPIVIAHWKKLLLQELSQKKVDLRLEPYNSKLLEEYNSLVKKFITYNQLLRRKSISLGPIISNTETLFSRLKLYKGMLKKTGKELEKAVTKIEKTWKPLDTIARDPFSSIFADVMVEITDALKPDFTPYEDNREAKACHELPSQSAACSSIKPSSERAGQLLKTRQSKGRTWSADDMWRGQVLDLMAEIFQSVCPYLDEDFSSSIMKIVMGYLLAQPLGTGLKVPLLGSRLETVDHQYRAKVYEMTYSETDMQNMTGVGNGSLRPMKPFWEQIINVLEDCKSSAQPMQFWHNEEDGKPSYITYRKFFQNNSTEAHYNVDDLMMEEKADQEYAFNWAIELNWRIFATVLGICMPRYENRIPLISARFYSLYSRDFLHPLRQIWMSNRDNPVFQTILGNYHLQGKAERWTKVCMESSFVESGDRNYRPPRSLYVNAFTEMNYFLSGPLAGTRGILSVAQNSL